MSRRRKPTQFLKVQEVAALLSVHSRTVYRRIKDGDLVAHELGGATRISEEDLAIYIARSRR